ncbi:MAG TPA: hypothetical protein VHW04_01995 [Solirubrobacteraceae bacterium]|nr:hypothetical protein [Solirubrobacteraceae bacterium]
MSAGRREAMADWLMVVGAMALVASLFLPWSHQLSGAVQAQYGASAALQGVPANPTAWQVYSAVDVVFALLAAALLVAALRGSRPARLALMAALAIAAAFTLHALSVPPTNGATLFDPSLTPPGYTPNPPGAGRGETLALVALGLGLGGLALSFTAD